MTTIKINPLNNKEMEQPKNKKQRVLRSRFAPKAVAGIRLEERDIQLLSDMYLHRNMARGQIESLYFGSTPRCNARLRQLFDHGFVKRYYLPAAPYGAQAIYSIGKAAVPIVARHLDADMTEVQRQYNRSKTPTFIEHTLEIVNVWIAFRKAVAERDDMEDDVEIELWLPEILCRHEYEIQVEGASRWTKEVFKPDAFIRLLNKETGEYSSFFIEVDLGHTSSRQFLGKLLTHQRYLESGLFRKTFGCENFRTLVITTSAKRVKNLCALTASGNNLFWYTTLDALSQFSVLGSIWQKSDEHLKDSLL